MRARRTIGLMALLAISGGAVPPPADDAPLPFTVGERLTYRVRAKGMGGRGTMSVDGPVEVRGRETYLLRFDVRAGLGPIKGANRTESWLDPRRMAALRFHAIERRPFSKHDLRVELYPEERRWEATNGRSGASPTDAPLDELSFIYFIRSLPLDADSLVTFNRYFDAERNPTTVRMLARDTIATDAGTFRTVLVEMRVRDPRHYAGEGVLRFQLSDDACRMPVRIESDMPDVGLVTFTLESYIHPAAPCQSEAP